MVLVLSSTLSTNLIVIYIFGLILRSQAAPEVSIDQGRLVGSTSTTNNDTIYYSFLGIPYAKPPVGLLRFKAPQPAENWTGIFNATQEGSACYSRHMLDYSTVIGSEDCLILNVYTKSLDNGLKPVLFWIHGGGFLAGSSSRDLYGPEFLMEEDIVLVTINYRFGIFGFLSLNDPSLDVPGNAGFKDMVMALKWVKKNIRRFGGDPDNVTIFGESAGACAVHLLILSSMARGLFHKGIAESGGAFNAGCEAAEHITSLASLFNLNATDESGIYKILMNKSMEELLEIEANTKDFKNFYPSMQIRFASVIEKHSNQPFLNESFIDIIAKRAFNDVPLIIGYNTLEGTIYELFGNREEPERPAGEDYVLHNFKYKSGSSESKKTANEIKEFYHNDKKLLQDRTLKCRMFGDPEFLYGIYINAFTQANRSYLPVYLYRMSIETELNVFKKFMNITLPGVSHLDEIGYLFKTAFTPEIISGSREDIAQRRFVKLWTNFAKYGNPTPFKDELLNNIQWTPIDPKNLMLLDIGEDLQMKKSPEMKMIEFWRNLELRSYSTRKEVVDYIEPQRSSTFNFIMSSFTFRLNIISNLE